MSGTMAGSIPGATGRIPATDRQDNMLELVSQLVDGELDDTSADRAMAAIKGEDALRRTWDTYHLVGDAIRGHMGADISAKVAARLRDEPTVLAPRHVPNLPDLRRWSLPAAAAVAAVAVVAWVARPAMSPEAQIAQMPAAAAPASPTLSDAPLSTGVENYLLAHQRFSGVTGQVRAVADERRVPASPAPSGSAQ